MKTPESVGLIEILKGESEFTQKELRKITRETTSYFPKGLLEFVLLDPFRLKQETPDEKKLASALENIRIKTRLDKIVGISRRIPYLKEKKGIICHAKAFLDKMVVVYNETQNLNGTSLNLAHDIGHLYGLTHCDYLFFFSRLKSYGFQVDLPTKFLLLRVLDYVDMYGPRITCRELRKTDIKEVNSIFDDCPERDYIMCAACEATKKSFSPRDYAWLESLMKTPDDNYVLKPLSLYKKGRKKLSI